MFVPMYMNTWCHNPGDHSLHFLRLENITPPIVFGLKHAKVPMVNRHLLSNSI